MARSKLFTPQIREKRGDVLDRTEEADMFMNVPVHPEVPDFLGPTDQGQAHYPLRMAGDRQQYVKGVQKRRFLTKTDKGIY